MWQEGGYFHAERNEDKKPYTIVMPPPNVTGQLHMGHAVDNTMQDILIRSKRMQGFEALWLPGTDHASIATEAKVAAVRRAVSVKPLRAPLEEMKYSRTDRPSRKLALTGISMVRPAVSAIRPRIPAS